MRTDDEREMDRELEDGWLEDWELDHDDDSEDMEDPCSITQNK